MFVGDTFCYFAGMTFAVAAILGHYSKTLLLFLLPQAFNFLFSMPQIFKVVPCPRHRLPKFNKETGLLENSVATFKKSELKPFGRFIVNVCKTLKMISYKEFTNEEEAEGGAGAGAIADGGGGSGSKEGGSKKVQSVEYIEVSNFTIVNLAIRIAGPTHEEMLTV